MKLSLNLVVVVLNVHTEFREIYLQPNSPSMK